MIFKGKGRLQIDNGVRIVTNSDIVRYYQWLIHKYHYNTIKTQTPAHGAHVTLWNPNLHRTANVDAIRQYEGKTIEFEYDAGNVYGGRTNFWIPVNCDEGYDLIAKMGIIYNKQWQGLHMTVCNFKFNN